MRTITAILDAQAAERPDEIYLIAPETGYAVTYRQLQRDVRRLGNDLRRRGLKPGAKIGLLLHNGYQTARLFLGIMYNGYVACPINLLAQATQLEYVLEHSDVELIYTSGENRDRLRAALVGVHRAIETEVIDVDAPDIVTNDPPDTPLPVLHEDNDALLMYTSGTTGRPKGVLLTHKNVVTGGHYTCAAHQLNGNDRVLCALPLYHINGQIVTVVAPLVSGGSVVMPHRFSVSSYWDTVSTYRCTWINVVPTIISYLLNGPDPFAAGKNLSLSQVRFCRSASAPLPPALHRAFEDRFRISVIETMGLTETAAPIFSNPLDPLKRKIGSPGIAFGNQARVVDLSGRPLPAFEKGEIVVRGDNVMRAYYKSAQQTAEAFLPDGWLRTGDLGYVDDDGFYFITGRLKELIIKGGENIAPREIDEVLLKHPAVLEAAAVGIPDPDYGQDILACVVLKPGHSCTALQLLDFCQAELGRFKTPKYIRFINALPKGPSGKVQRMKLLSAQD